MLQNSLEMPLLKKHCIFKEFSGKHNDCSVSKINNTRKQNVPGETVFVENTDLLHCSMPMNKTDLVGQPFDNLALHSRDRP